jgi:hypothetical protein
MTRTAIKPGDQYFLGPYYAFGVSPGTVTVDRLKPGEWVAWTGVRHNERGPYTIKGGSRFDKFTAQAVLIETAAPRTGQLR